MPRVFYAPVTHFGGYLEDYEVGDVYHHWPGKTITDAEVHLFCMLTFAVNPLDIDSHFAATEMELTKNIAVGTYIYSLLLGMSVPDISGRAVANLGADDLRHVAPVYYGDTIYGRTEIISTRVSASRPGGGHTHRRYHGDQSGRVGGVHLPPERPAAEAARSRRGADNASSTLQKANQQGFSSDAGADRDSDAIPRRRRFGPIGPAHHRYGYYRRRPGRSEVPGRLRSRRNKSRVAERRLGRRLGWALDDQDDSFFWKIIGRNKKCVAIDLKSEAGLKPDAPAHRFRRRPDRELQARYARAFGVATEVLLERNPRLVVLRVTGFGQGGPYAGRPGFATVVEALTGYAALSGEPDGQPLLPPIAITDEISGLAGAFAVMTALWYARRTGRGQVVDVNLAETLLQLMGPLVPAFAHLGYRQPRMGSSLPWTVPRGTYQCSDGQWVAISASADSVAARLLDRVGLAGDKRFATFHDRMANQEAARGLRAQLDRGADRGRGNRSPGGSRRHGSDAALHNA